MLERYNIRTDLALEERERFEEEHVEIAGVEVKEEYNEQLEMKVTTVKVTTENGAKTMGKPVGTYITVEAPNMAVPDEDYHREISKKLAEYLKKMVQNYAKQRNDSSEEEFSVLVAGLGNRQVTPDSLGPASDYKTYCKGVRKICYGKRKSLPCKRSCSGSHGDDRDGDSGDSKRYCRRNKSGYRDCGRCAGSSQQ